MTRAPLLLAVLISTLCGAYTHTAPAATVRMASETFVTNKITQAIAALPPATSDLTPATNYTDSATNALTDALTTWDNPIIVSQARSADTAISADNASYAERSGQANFAEGAAFSDWTTGLAGETQPIRRGDAIFAQLDAATATNAQQTAQIAAVAQSATNYTDSAIADADTSYRRVSFLTNLNQSVQYVSVSAAAPTTLAIDLPAGANTADWIVYVTSVTNVSLSLPSATWYMADEAYTNDIPPATPTALYFTQMADGLYMLGRQELKPITIVR